MGFRSFISTVSNPKSGGSNAGEVERLAKDLDVSKSEARKILQG